jgi:hypothetical protein
MAKRPSAAPRRPHWTEADARRVLADWERSDDSLEAFARSRGLVPQRLAWWRNRLRGPRPEASAALTLVPAVVIDAGARTADMGAPQGTALSTTAMGERIRRDLLERG